MVLLALGLLLWFAAHLLGRLAPDLHRRLGGRMGMALIALASLALMIYGYRTAEGSVFWGRSPMLTGINNLLVLIAVYIFAAAGMKTKLGRILPEPMMWGVALWAIAHLLVNGDTPSFLLFGGLLLWAFVQMAVLLAKKPREILPVKQVKFELFAVLGTLVVYGAMAAVHGALGYPVFG